MTDRDLWQGYPSATEDDRSFLARLAAAGRGETRIVTVDGPGGAARRAEVRLSIAVEEECDGRSDVVCRLEFVSPSPGEGETVRENLWDLARSFLAEKDEEARGAPSGGA